MSKISPLRALNSFYMHTCTREKPVKPSFSVRVENMPYNCSVCQNTADLHLIQWLVMPFESSLILPYSLPYRTPGKPDRTPMRGSFSLTEDSREVFWAVARGKIIVKQESIEYKKFRLFFLCLNFSSKGTDNPTCRIKLPVRYGDHNIKGPDNIKPDQLGK